MADGAVARSMFLEKNAEAEKWRGVAQMLAAHIASLNPDNDPLVDADDWLDWGLMRWRKTLPHG